MLRIFLKFTLFRLTSVFLVRTQYVPDEYWQSLEIAHLHTFGYGYKTWEYRVGVRNYLYSSVFYFLYVLLELSSLDYLYFLIHLPRILQAILSAYCDSCFFQLARQFRITPKWIYMFIFTDWYSYYSCSRTLINTLETNLVVLGLFAFPWKTLSDSKDTIVNNSFAVIISLSCFVRPTACVIWLPFCLYWLCVVPRSVKRKIFLMFLRCGSLIFCVLTIVDSLFHGNFVVTPFEFIKFNILSGLSAFYGTHPFFWYMTQGLPVVLGILVIPLIVSLFQRLAEAKLAIFKGKKGLHANFMLLFTAVASLLTYSSIPHKEFRFIHPLVPIMALLALQPLESLRSDKLRKLFSLCMVFGFLFPTIFFGLIHQRGPLSAMTTLASDAAEKPNETSFLLLMPCHSTPLYSHIHVPVPVRFITCEPPLNNYTIDESENFFSSPLTWLKIFWSENRPVSHVIMFDSLGPVLNEFLVRENFVKMPAIFHTLFPEKRTGREIWIYRSSRWLTKDTTDL